MRLIAAYDAIVVNGLLAVYAIVSVITRKRTTIRPRDIHGYFRPRRRPVSLSIVDPLPLSHASSMFMDAEMLGDCIGNSPLPRHMTSSHETFTGWVLMQRRASINAPAHVNVLVHNVVGNVVRHMAAQRFAWHINPKSGCRPIANNKPDRTRQRATYERLSQHLDTNPRLKFVIAKLE